MGSWGTSVFSDDLAQDVRREYNILLSVGKDNNDIEELLTNYYRNILNCNNPDEDVFWFSLSLCEWKKGRLSVYVKEKALAALESGQDLNRWSVAGNDRDFINRKKALSNLKEIILSPQPSAKKVRKPTVYHCPWKVGSLLAYRIVSNKNLIDNPCFMKYVLLRIIKIDRHPVSRIFDTGYYDESMTVGLYNWIGSQIPDPKITRDLKYIAIKECSQALKPFWGNKDVRSVQLDWVSTKNEKGDITYLDCDEGYNSIPEFFESSTNVKLLTHFFAFDVTLSKRFERYLHDDCNFDYIIV